MEMKRVVARFMVHKVGSFVVKERVLCFGEYGFSTFDREAEQLTNTWAYEDVDSVNVLEGETDFVIHTPRHRVKKTVYRCHYRMEVMVCLMRLRSQHAAKMPTGQAVRPELQTYWFDCVKYLKKGLQVKCIVEIRPDGVYQKDKEGELMSHIPYTSLVSIDVICDDHDAILLNHSDNSSLFVVPRRRTELAEAIRRVMKAYGIPINEYRKKTLERALKDEPHAPSTEIISCQYGVLKVSQSNESTATPRVLAISEKYVIEYEEPRTLISSRPLARIYCLVLFQDTLQAFEIVYVDGVRRKYYSEQREKIICELLASCHALGNLQVSVEMGHVPDWVQMVPRKVIQAEGAKMHSKVGDVNVQDRELRVAQASIIHLLALHGYSKTARVQRQLPRGLDEDMHSLAVELNANTPTLGVIAQPNKPYEKVVFVVAREIHDIVGRHGAEHDFICTYLQALYRVMLVPQAKDEFVRILTERGEEYISTITKILTCRRSVTTYWMIMVLHRLIESKAHKATFREIVLSNNLFVVTILSLFDEDTQTQKYLPDLPTMKLCEFILALVKANIEKQHKLSDMLYQHLATKYRMMLRILFGFPALATVETLVGILGRMTRNPAFLHFGNMSSPVRSRDGQIPRHTLSFGETMNYGVGVYRPPVSSRYGGVPLSRSYLSSSRYNSVSSASSVGSVGKGVVSVQNPEILLKQYRLFVESSYGSEKKSLSDHEDPVFLRLRYRCRNIFLQELMSHMVGNFEDFKRVYSVECYQFSGFLGSSDGQREKSDIFLTPRAVIAVRVLNRNTNEFEFRDITDVSVAMNVPNTFSITVKGKVKYVYSDQSADILDKMTDLAGVIGINLLPTTREKLPKPSLSKAPRDEDIEPADVFDVQRRTGRHGFALFRKKKLIFVDNAIQEIAEGEERMYSLKALRRVVVPNTDSDNTEITAVLDFADGARIAYAPYDIDVFLGALYDSYRQAKNWTVSLTRDFSRVNPRMTVRSLLRSEEERNSLLKDEGLYPTAHAVLSKEIERMSRDGATTSSIDKVFFALESFVMNVEMEDFGGKSVHAKLEQLSFAALLRGMTQLLENACKPPIRGEEVAIILDSFCRINDGCYQMTLAQTDASTATLVSLLSQILVSGDSIATVWAVNAFYSLVSNKSHAGGQPSAEKRVRFQVFENKKLVQLLVGILDQRNPVVTLATLELFVDVLIHSRHLTDNNQFETITKTFSSKHPELLRLASQNTNGGITASAICILKVIVDHCDSKTRQRICDTALETGLTLKCFYKALFHPIADAREAYQCISGVWMAHHKPSFEMLVRILPHGFIRMLSHSSTRKLMRKDRDKATSRTRTTNKGRYGDRTDARLEASEAFIKRVHREVAALFSENKAQVPKSKLDNARSNYPGESSTDIQLLARMIHRDFYLPDLIWTEKSRGELRRALEKAIDEFEEFKSSRTSVMALVATLGKTKELLWNYEHFQVQYSSLAGELEVGGFYVRVLWERIDDGSVRLGEIAQIIHDNTVQNGYRGKIKGHSESFYSCIEIAKNPATLFNEVYQCWLENLYTTLSKSGKEAGALSRTGSGYVHNIASMEKYDQNGDWLLKLLVALAKAFPGVGSVTKHRAEFLLSFLRSSYTATDIQDVLELLGEVTGSVESSERFCSTSNLELFLHMSLLAHRSRQSGFAAISNGNGHLDEDVPVMELQPLSDAGRASSVPIAGLSFYDNSRFNLKWSVKVETNSKDGEKVDGENAVAGPFSSVDLRQFLDTDPVMLLGDVQRISVCCCSLQEDVDSHAHSWNLIFTTPELRWMELTDEPVDPQCATSALKIMRNFLCSSRAPKSPMFEYWPLPMATAAISSSSTLPLLTQLLLVNNDEARSHVCDILFCLEDTVAEKLYMYGAFFFILASDNQSKASGSFVAEAKFLSRFHRIQRVDEKQYGQSCLLDIFPESLVGLLDSDTPEYFADVYTGRKRDKRILWSASMRQHLQEMVSEHLHEFTSELARNVTALYSYVSLPPVSYTELSGDVYCSGYYLSTFIQPDADLEAIEEPVILMSSIEDKWRFLDRHQVQDTTTGQDSSTAFEVFGWTKEKTYSMQTLRERYRELCKNGTDPRAARGAFDTLCALYDRKDDVDTGKTSDDVIECILKAQVKLLDHFSIQFSSYYCKSLDLLLKKLTQADSSSQHFPNLAMKVLHRMLSAAPHNCARLLEIEGSWDAILETVEKYAFQRDIEAKELLFSILQLILASEGGMKSLMAANRHETIPGMPPSTVVSRFREDEDDEASFFTATEYLSQNGDGRVAKYAERIYTLLDDVILSFENIQPWHIQKLSFDIVSEICRNLDVRDQILTSTRVFWKGLYLILASAASTEEEHTSVSKLEKQERDMLESAFSALRALAIGTDGQSRSKGLDALANLLPLDFLDCLDKPNGHEFCTIILSDIYEPSCIWNGDTRSELSLLTEEYCMSGNGDELSILESATSYMYDCLQAEPRVGGIYLNILLEKGSTQPESITANTLFPASPISFLESLFLFLNENRDPKLGIYSDTLPALECLSLLADVPSFRGAFVECLEMHADDSDAATAAISVATLGRYLIPFDGNTDASKAVSISSRRMLSNYGFKSKPGASDANPDSLEAQFGNVDYQKRQELALLVLNKLCGFPTNLEKMMAPFCQYTWALQVITDHLGFEQAFYALSCLAELCDTCLSIAEYVEVSGLWVEILGLALQSKQHVLHDHFLRAEALREPAFEVIYALLDKDAGIRERMCEGLQRFLPYPIVYQIHYDPSKAARFFDDNHEKSDLIWNSHKRTEVRKKLDEIICRNRNERTLAKRDSVLLNDDDRIQYPSNFIGGLYLERFLSRPDPERLTNPAYNLELLFQLWCTELEGLMAFDLQNPPETLKVTTQLVDKLTSAMNVILRTPLEIDEKIATSGMPEQIVKLVRHCNKHLITSFPYRCVLRIARRLVQFPQICSANFLELLFCRMTIEHADLPSLVKLVRRILEARNATALAEGKKAEPEFLLRDLKYYPQMIAFLESLVAKDKDIIDGALLSNVNRVLRIAYAESPKEESFKSMSRSFMGRWHNFTIAETRSSIMRGSSKITDGNHVNTSSAVARPSAAAPSFRSMQSFDVDAEREAPPSTFNVDEERRVEGLMSEAIPEDEFESFVATAPPKSIKFEGDTLEVVDAVAPTSFRYSGNLPDDLSIISPAPMSMSAQYDLHDSRYHSQKAEEYDVEVDIDELRNQVARRGSDPERTQPSTVPSSAIDSINDYSISSYAQRSADIVRDSDMTSFTSGMQSERRYSVLDPWKAPPSTMQSDTSSLMSVTISRRGRRAAATYSRNKSRQKKKWYHIK